jgi:2-polyprenyl-6-methoxyphenol hydroxylase-like FAD-dependent oxidoreductase
MCPGFFRFLLCAFFSAPLLCVPVPFKTPDSYEKLAEQINSAGSKVALVSGAGPAGLMASWTLIKSGQFQLVILLEKRTEFTRLNTLTIRAEVFSWLEEVGLADAIRDKIIYSPSSIFTFVNGVGDKKCLVFNQTRNLPPVDFSVPLESIFAPNHGAHFAIEVERFQDIIANLLIQEENFYLLNAEPELILGSENMGAKVSGETFSFPIINPQIIVIAEGTKSSSRTKAGIQFYKVVTKADEYWISGVISLEGIISEDYWQETTGEIFLFLDQKNRRSGLGVLRPAHRNLFVNARIDEQDAWVDPKVILKETAFALLSERPKDLFTVLPQNADGLTIVDTWGCKLHLEFKKATQATMKNVVMLGDALRSGSPIGGFGFSLVASVENRAFGKLIKKFFTEEKLPAMATFNEAMEAITQFWHSHNEV